MPHVVLSHRGRGIEGVICVSRDENSQVLADDCWGGTYLFSLVAGGDCFTAFLVYLVDHQDVWEP